MRFKINLATKIYINTRLLRLCTSAAVVLLAAMLFLNAGNIAAKADEVRRLTNEIAAHEEKKAKTAGKGVSEKEYSALLARIGFANAVIERKTYNWLELLDRLEQVAPDGIAITSIVPDTKSQGVKLAGVARSFNNLRTFIEHLEDAKFFTDVYLMNQSDIKLGDTAQGITFNLSCRVAGK